jgi:hypothetical protein
VPDIFILKFLLLMLFFELLFFSVLEFDKLSSFPPFSVLVCSSYMAISYPQFVYYCLFVQLTDFNVLWT